MGGWLVRSWLSRAALFSVLLFVVGCGPNLRVVPLYVEVRGPVDATVYVAECPGDGFRSVGVEQADEQGLLYLGPPSDAVTQARVAELVINQDSLTSGQVLAGYEAYVNRPYRGPLPNFASVGGVDYWTRSLRTNFAASLLDDVGPGMYRVDGTGESAGLVPATLDETEYLRLVCGS